MWVGWFALAVGLLAIFGGIFDWSWYLETPRGQIWVNLLGRNGARAFFVVVGGLLCVGGFWMVSKG